MSIVPLHHTVTKNLFLCFMVVLIWLELCVQIWIFLVGWLILFLLSSVERLNSLNQQLFVVYAVVWSQWIFSSSVTCAKFDAFIPTAWTLLWIHGPALTAKIFKDSTFSAVDDASPLSRALNQQYLSLDIESCFAQYTETLLLIGSGLWNIILVAKFRYNRDNKKRYCC